MAERRAAAKGRRMGSSRRKQLREASGEALAAAPGPSEELPWASEIAQRVQDFFRERDKDQAGFVTRSDLQKLQEEDFPCSTEELELIFDGLDAAGTGRLSTEEFTAGLSQFLRSQKAARDHRRRKTASRRVRLVLPSPALEGVDSEEWRHFATFMDQLGTDNISSEQEIWQLWVKLRQDEPQLLGNLEDFLAKMRRRIQEARSKKEALEVTLNKHVAEHDKEVQQLCEALEQKIQQEQQRLEQESMARSHQHGVELQQALDASEREVQRLVMAQMELETRCRSLRSMQQATSTENRQLEESNRVLEDHLQHLHQQLQQTRERLQTARAMMAQEHAEEPRDRAVTELPGEMPLSPQMSLEKSEEYHSKMWIRLESQSTEPKAKSTHQVVWERLPAEISVLGTPPRASSMEEDAFPEFLKEECFSDQSSLLREMNDAIAALSKQLKPQALGAPPAPADAAHHPRDDVEPQMGPEAAAAHGTTPGVLRETLPGHAGHELFEGDLKEGSATAELHAPDMTQTGASVGAGHHRAQEPGAEQGESPEEARRMLFLQGKGAGVMELMLKAAEHPQGALGESTEAGEQAFMEVEGEGWKQEKTGWEKAQLLGEAEEAALNQGGNLDAGLGQPEAGKAGLAARWQLATDELGLAAAPQECVQPVGAGLGEEADPPSGLSEKLEIKPGERLEPEPPSWGEVRMGAAQGDGLLPEVTVAPDPSTLEEERVGAEVQSWGETLDADVWPGPAQHGGSSGAGAEEGEVEVTQPREAEPQPQGESARGDTAWGGSTGAEVLPPPTNVQEGGAGTDVQPLEAQSSDANVQLLAQVEAALQPPSEAGSLGTEQGGRVAPGVQPLEEGDKPELGLEEEMGAPVVHGEGPSPAETPAGSQDLCGLLQVKAQALELVEAEDAQADTQLHGGASPEMPQGGEGRAAMELREEAEDGAQGQGEHEMSPEPGLLSHGMAIRQGEGAAADVQPWEGAEILDVLEDQSSDANVHLLAEEDKLKLALEGNTETDLQLLSEVSSPGTEQGGSVAPDVQPLDQVDRQELVELQAEDAQADTQLHEGSSPEMPQGGEGHAAMELGEEAENGAQGQGEQELPHEPGLLPHSMAIRQGEGAAADVQPWEEAEILDVLEDQSSDANVHLLAEKDKLRLALGGSMEADLQLSSEVSSPGTEQGGSVAPDVQPQGQDDKLELVEMVETEDSWLDIQLHGGSSPETPQGGEGHAAMELGEEAEDGAQGQGEHEMSPEPGLLSHGMAIRQGEGAAADVQPWEEAEILDVLEDQSSDANVHLLAEEDKLKLAPEGNTETDLQLLSEVSSPGTEQGGSVAPDVQPLDQVDRQELVELQAEDAQADTQLHEGSSPEMPQGGEGHAAMELGEEAENGAQGQGEQELPHEPGLLPHSMAIRQGEGAAADVQPWEEAEILDALEDQSSDANVHLLAEEDKLRLALGGSMEADLQLSSEVSSPGTEQGGSVAPDVQPQGQVDKLELVEMVETEDSWLDIQLHGGSSPETPQGGEGHAAMELGEEAEDGAQGQGEREMSPEPGLLSHGMAIRQGEGAAADVQPWEEAEILDVLEDQSSDANVHLLAEEDKLKLALEGNTETDLQLSSEVSSLDTEQGGSVALVKMEAEDAQADTQLHGGSSPETPQGGEGHAAMELGEEAEDGAQGQGEQELPPEPGLDPQGAGVRQGEGAAADVQPWEEAGSLVTLEDWSAGASMQPFTEAEELKSTLGGSREADLSPLGAAGMREGEQSQTPGLEAGLWAAHAADLWEWAAGARVSPPDEAALHPERAAAAEDPGLEAMVGALTGPVGQILEDTQTLEIPQGERADAEEKPLDGAQGLEVVHGERLETGVRILVETQSLGIKQGHDDDASVLAPPVSEVTLQISTLKLETMMQEDVLIPDVQRLGASGQEAQNELQEQVSAQTDKVRLHAASQQLEEKPPYMMETERVAAGPAKPPKQEVPPVSTHHTRVQQDEDAGNDQLGMVLRDSSLGDAANGSMQPQRQLLGEQGENLNVGQQEKQQEVGWKMSQDGKPSPGEPGAMTADGAGAVPRGSSEASLDPDHIYNVLFVGDSHVGKTSFLYRLHANAFNPYLKASIGLDYWTKNVVVDNKHFSLRLWDSAGQERYYSITKQFFRKADGVVLMYDITSECSFSDVQYWLNCIQEGAEDGVTILLLGNKTDCAAKRRVPTKEGERLAKKHQLMFYECSAASGHNVSEAMVSLIRSLKVREDELKNKAEEVPKPPQKKKACC